ncbi:hypothetical protein [Alysiella crassa]|uniref:hypothetical protein n=1 Tax=Alysiella crassa TaxID=153491 RepID=UPI0011C07A6F|nr:hypothetical protein [Alysiella crassa]UOP07553.1 hypothetical protein LVJ80_03930 [Alysiella crassa]
MFGVVYCRVLPCMEKHVNPHQPPRHFDFFRAISITFLSNYDDDLIKKIIKNAHFLAFRLPENVKKPAY